MTKSVIFSCFNLLHDKPYVERLQKSRISTILLVQTAMLFGQLCCVGCTSRRLGKNYLQHALHVSFEFVSCSHFKFTAQSHNCSWKISECLLISWKMQNCEEMGWACFLCHAAGHVVKFTLKHLVVNVFLVSSHEI